MTNPRPGFPNVGLVAAGMPQGMARMPTFGAPAPAPTRAQQPYPYPSGGTIVPAPGSPQSISVPIQPDTYEYLVVGLANPYAQRWIPAATVFSHQTNLTPREGGVVHPGNSPETDRPEPNRWWHLVTQPSEALFDPATIDPATFDPWSLALNFGMPSSMLKLRIKLGLGWSRIRVLDVDVGPGVELLLSAKWVNSVEVLVPDPTSVPADLPEDIVESPRNFATLLRSRISCELAPAGARCTYSQLFHTPAAVPFALMPIKAAAHEVQVFARTPFAGGTTVQFVQVRDTPFVEMSQVAIPPPLFAVVGTIDTPATSTMTARVLIPGQANGILISSGDTNDYNVVQELTIA